MPVPGDRDRYVRIAKPSSGRRAEARQRRPDRMPNKSRRPEKVSGWPPAAEIERSSARRVANVQLLTVAQARARRCRGRSVLPSVGLPATSCSAKTNRSRRHRSPPTISAWRSASCLVAVVVATRWPALRLHRRCVDRCARRRARHGCTVPGEFLVLRLRPRRARRFQRLYAEAPLCRSRRLALLLQGQGDFLDPGRRHRLGGPRTQIVIFAAIYFAPVWFAGAFVPSVPVCIVALFFFVRCGCRTTPRHRPIMSSLPRVRCAEIAGSQRFMTGMNLRISSYVLMTFMMTGAPVAMVWPCGFSSDLATLGIQWHVLAMFAPSFVTGWLISRFGAERIVAAVSSC